MDTGASWAGSLLVGGLLLLGTPTATAAEGAGTGVAGQPGPHLQPPNVLLVIGDDMGVDTVAAYGEHPDAGPTPVIDGLAADGLLFRNAWAMPGCSPTRAALLTGRPAYETGIGFVVNYENFTFELSTDLPNLASMLAPTHRTAAVGKWHLAAEQVSGAVHPLLMGFEHHRGPMHNLGNDPNGYFVYEKFTDGVPETSRKYATTEQVDDALELIHEFGNDPWFVWLAFNAPHGPYHKPPRELTTLDLPPRVTDDIPLHMRAMIEALDTELGRLLDSLDPLVRARTIVIFVGDNGTAKIGTTPPFDPDHAKGTAYEGGVNVPLILCGPGIPRGAECDGLVHVTDLLATVADLCGVTAPEGTGSVSLAPYLDDPGQPSLRPYVTTDAFKPNGYPEVYYIYRRTVRDEQYKLLWVFSNSTEPVKREFYDLQADPFETEDLLRNGPLSLQQMTEFQQLETILDTGGP